MQPALLAELQIHCGAMDCGSMWAAQHAIAHPCLLGMTITEETHTFRTVMGMALLAMRVAIRRARLIMRLAFPSSSCSSADLFLACKIQSQTILTRRRPRQKSAVR